MQESIRRDPAPYPIAIGAMMVLLAVAAVFLTLRVAGTLGAFVSYGSQEGFNAYYAAAAMAGGNLYPDPSSLMHDNYPPLSYYIVGFAGRALGDNIIAGRILSFLGFLAAALGIAKAARLMGCCRLESAFSALLFMIPLTMDYAFVGMNDPQMLGHAADMAGFVLLLIEPRRTGAVTAAALFFSLAFFIKHDLVVQPVVMVLWLAVTDRRSAIRLALSGLVFALAGFIAFDLCFGTSLWSQLDSPRQYFLRDSMNGLWGWLELGLAPVLASAALAWRYRRDRHFVLCLLYLGVAIATGAWFIGGVGVSGNVLFDALIALALCGGVGLNRLSRDVSLKPRGMAAVGFAFLHTAPLLAGLVFLLVTGSINARWWLKPDAPARIAMRRDTTFLESRKGPALCANLTLCYWSGKPAAGDAYMIAQYLAGGRLDPNVLRDAFAERRYGVIQLDRSPEKDFLAPKAVVDALWANYRLDHADALGALLVPKDR